MRRAQLVALFFLASCLPADAGANRIGAERQRLYWTSDWPVGVPDPTRWKLSDEISLVEGGQVDLADAFVIFELHAQPGRVGLWQVGRFRICYKGQQCDPETLVWLKPSARAQVFYRLKHRSWKKFWLGTEFYWYRLPDGSPEYRAELGNARKIFRLVPRLRGIGREDYRNLTF